MSGEFLDEDFLQRRRIEDACAKLRQKYASLYALPKRKFRRLVLAALWYGRKRGYFNAPLIKSGK